MGKVRPHALMQWYDKGNQYKSRFVLNTNKYLNLFYTNMMEMNICFQKYLPIDLSIHHTLFCGFHPPREEIVIISQSAQCSLRDNSKPDKTFLHKSARGRIWVSFPRTGEMAISHLFFLKVERSCGQTVKDKFDFSIVLSQLYLLHHQNTSRWTS